MTQVCLPSSRPSSLSTVRILIVAADPTVALPVATTVCGAGGAVVVAQSVEEARSELAMDTFDSAVIDDEVADDPDEPLIQTLRAQARPCMSVVLTRSTDTAVVHALVTAGALDIVFLPIDRDRLLEALSRSVMTSHRLWTRLAEPTRTPHSIPPERAARSRAPKRIDGDFEIAVTALSDSFQLSEREAHVLRYIALGYRYQEISTELSISPRTVKMHAANVRRKAGVSNRYELLRKMFRA
jgi:DNA-binding NarL/FixJ family response regulator